VDSTFGISDVFSENENVNVHWIRMAEAEKVANGFFHMSRTLTGMGVFLPQDKDERALTISQFDAAWVDTGHCPSIDRIALLQTARL